MPRLTDTLLLYARTARGLRPRQWIYQPVRRLQRLLPASPRRERAAVRDLSSMRVVMRAIGPRHRESVARAEAVLAGEFTFLGRTERLGTVDWGKRHVSHLWSYNLHYFDYALDLAWAFVQTGDARYRDGFVTLADSWIAASVGGRGDGWEPYPLSLRAVNWMYAMILMSEAMSLADGERLADSIHEQLSWLERRVEWHLLANHLQKNLQALAMGGLFFSGPRAHARLERWGPQLWAQLLEQVLPDGGHFERSPMYHLIALADFLECVALYRATGQAPPATALTRLDAMVRATSVLVHPSGKVHLFNDSANGVAPPLEYLDRLASHVGGAGTEPGEGLLDLPTTGYFGVASAEGDRLLIDCGEPGPAYQPGHAHNDLLSFELDLGGDPFIVDSGVSGYDDDPLRSYVRSTRAHNTVSVDGGEQNELWGTFRMARRATGISASHTRETAGRYTFHGAYTPYFDTAVRHVREIQRDAGDRSVSVVDVVTGARGRSIESFVHLHPDVDVRIEGHRAIARVAQGEVMIEFSGIDALAVERASASQGWYCPAFGTAQPTSCLIATIRAGSDRPFGYRISMAR